MSKNILVHFGGVDVTDYVRRAVKTETYGDSISTYDIEVVKTISSIVTISASLTVEVWLDSNEPPTTKVFNGFINNFEPQDGVIKITARDELAKLINKQVTKYYDSSVIGDPSYPDGKISAIFNDLVETYGGLSTNGGATIQDSGTDIVVTKFACNSADIFERCRKLAEALNWVFYYRADTGFVYFEPKNYNSNTNTLQVGTNVIEIPKWDYDRSEMINDLTINGAQQLVSTSEVFSGNGSNVTFTLANVPDAVTVYYAAAKNYATTAKLQSEVKIVDLPNSLSTHDVEVDIKNKTITFTSFIPASGTNNILVEYAYYVPIPVHLDEPNSIATYGYYSKTLDFTDILTFNDAWKRGQNLLTKYSVPFKSTKLKTLWTSTLDARVGQQVQAIDTVNTPTVNQAFTIYRTRDYWPEAFTEIEVGDKQYTIEEYQANVIERLKRLEETIIGTGATVPTEIKQNLIQFGFTPETTQTIIQFANDSFILNHPTNGVLYAEEETAILEDFEDYSTWSSTGLTQTLSNDSTSGHYWVGTQGVKTAWTGTGIGDIYKTITSTDMSSITGVSSGTPIQGTIGLWVYLADSTKITNLSLIIGNDASNYKKYAAETYAQKVGLVTGFTPVDGLNYLLFNLTSPTSTLGTIDWTTIDYARIEWVTTGATEMTFDYLTASKSNDIGLNGLGDRTTTYSSTTYTW